MKIIRNRSRLLWVSQTRIFNDDLLSSNICIPLLSVFFIEERKKKEQKNKRNRKINTQKNSIEQESNQEPFDHQSCILPLH